MSETEQKPQTEEQPKKEENATPAEEPPKPEENGVKEDGDAGKTEEKEEGGAEATTENAAAEGKTEAKEEVNLEAPKENPFSEDDLEQILQLEASEGEDSGWQKGKNQKGVTVFKKSEKNGVPIIKAYMEFSGIPCDKVLELLTNVEERKKWNKKTPTYEVLEERDDFKIIYQVIKMPTACDDRDMVQSTIVRSDADQKRHVLLYKACNHPNKPPNKGAIRADVTLMGVVIRPKEEEENTTKLTWISQISLKGWVPKMVVNRVTMGYPVSLHDDLSQYWKKLTAPKEEPKKEKKAEEKKEDGEEKKEEVEEKKEEKNEEAAAPAEEENKEEEKPKENGEQAEEEKKEEEKAEEAK
ncbi:uncharacterized protein [Amphiura filiformis]|uniref:uncharacterized protein n=1 Tax=Amphiura filiformis TaxID=82378 RepID=UPI003B21E3C4